MDLVNDLSNDLAVALFVDRTLERKLERSDAKSFIARFAEVMSAISELSTVPGDRENNRALASDVSH